MKAGTVEFFSSRFISRSRGMWTQCQRGSTLFTTLVLTIVAMFLLADRAAAVVGPCGSEGFGVCAFSSPMIANESGTPATQAGSHPYTVTTSIGFDDLIEEEIPRSVRLGGAENPELIGKIYGEPRHLAVNFPQGMIINPNAATRKCTEAQFETREKAGGGCPLGSVIGVATLRAMFLGVLRSPVFVMQPAPGSPAELGLNFGEIGLTAHVFGNARTGTDYGLTGDTNEIPQIVQIASLEVALWGEPSNPSHDPERGGCSKKLKVTKARELEIYLKDVEQAAAEHTLPPPESSFFFSCPLNGNERTTTPVLTMPGSCTGKALETTMSTDSWQESAKLIEPGSFTSPAVTGCENLSFTPTLRTGSEPAGVGPESPSGLDLDLKIPQEEGSLGATAGLATANLKNAVVTLPAGVAASPSAANGLEGCSPAQVGFKGINPGTGVAEFTPKLPNPLEPGVNFCPNGSKLGEVEVVTPLLEKPVKGGLYLAQQGTFEGALVGMYIVAEGQGALVKLGGTATLDESTGQITVTFKNNPQLPFSELRLKTFAGPRAALITPPACGAYATTSDLTPWSSPFAPDATPSSRDFVVSSDCAVGGFSPFFQAGTTNNQAGAFSQFSVTIARQDREQRLSGVQVTTPPGLLGVLKSVEQCPEPQASQGQCGPASKIGEATVSVGPGSAPYTVNGGEVYLTGPYHDAPFGLSIVVPTTAGPFTLTGNGGLGREIVRAKVEIDSHTAQVRVSSDPLPTILQGIPLDVRTINVDVNRPGFMFNPTNCSQLSVTGVLASTANTSTVVSSPFEAANCANLPFKPKFTASTAAKTSKARGASLTVEVVPGAGQANIAKVRVALPKQLPARLATLQKACTDAVFNANPAACPAPSLVGTATAVTPLLAHSLKGPAYLVSHGGAAFPDLVFVLQGEGITLYLDGNTNIKKGITTSTFNSVPDAPVSSFETTFPEGPHSVLATDIPIKAKGSMCGQKLMMPTAITGQNGAVVTQATKTAISGCSKKTKSPGKPGHRGKRK